MNQRDRNSSKTLDTETGGLPLGRCILLLLVLLASCGGDPGPPSSPSLQAWLDTIPVFSIGSVDGREPYNFTSIQAVALASDGSLAVTERNPPEIRVFDSNGRHRGTIGREGEGPGEFVGPPKLRFLGTDTLLAWDPRQFRLTWFRLDGRVLREVSLAMQVMESRSGQARVTSWWDVLPDGSVLAPDFLNSRSLFRLDANDLSVTRIAPLYGHFMPVADGVSVGSLFLTTPFRASTSYAAGGDGTIWVADSLRWTVRGYSTNGTLMEEFHIPKQRVPVTPNLLETIRGETLTLYEREQSGPLEDAFNRLEHPDSVVAIRQLFWEDPGFLWLGHSITGFSPPVEWEVMTVDGHWLGHISVPPQLGVLKAVGYGRIVTIWRDQLDVPHINVYALHRSVGSSQG